MSENRVEVCLVSFYGQEGFVPALMVFRDSERFHAINENRLERYAAPSLKDLLTAIYPNWTWSAIARKKRIKGERALRLSNPIPELPASLSFAHK